MGSINRRWCGQISIQRDHPASKVSRGVMEHRPGGRKQGYQSGCLCCLCTKPWLSSAELIKRLINQHSCTLWDDRRQKWLTQQLTNVTAGPGAPSLHSTTFCGALYLQAAFSHLQRVVTAVPTVTYRHSKDHRQKGIISSVVSFLARKTFPEASQKTLLFIPLFQTGSQIHSKTNHYQGNKMKYLA